MLHVACSRCPDTAEPIGVVRRSSAGLVFDGQGQGSVDAGSDLNESVRSLLGGREVPFETPLRVVVLLERPPDPYADWPPRATCAVHGIDVFEAQHLVEAVEAAEAAAAAEAAGDRPARFRNGPKKVGH